MSNFILNLISWVLLLLVILTLFLIDKVNQLIRLQKQQSLFDTSVTQPPPSEDAASDLLFLGLQGKKLWDAMSGKSVEGFGSAQIDALRPHYEPILRQHIVEAFNDGLVAVQKGCDQKSASLRIIPTPRGHVESWLPPQHRGSIYRTAMEFGAHCLKVPDDQMLARLRQTLDSIVDILYQRTGLTNEVPLSGSLLNPATYIAPEASAVQKVSDTVHSPDDVTTEVSGGMAQSPEKSPIV